MISCTSSEQSGAMNVEIASLSAEKDGNLVRLAAPFEVHANKAINVGF